jgi:hypothetical protein
MKKVLPEPHSPKMPMDSGSRVVPLAAMRAKARASSSTSSRSSIAIEGSSAPKLAT